MGAGAGAAATAAGVAGAIGVSTGTSLVTVEQAHRDSAASAAERMRFISDRPLARGAGKSSSRVSPAATDSRARALLHRTGRRSPLLPTAHPSGRPLITLWRPPVRAGLLLGPH